jgi:hypothetical protein
MSPLPPSPWMKTLIQGQMFDWVSFPITQI